MIKGLVKCACGGNPQFITVRYAYGAIACDTCGIRTREQHCDDSWYDRNLKTSWRKTFTKKRKVKKNANKNK